jgi:hypothetical protein
MEISDAAFEAAAQLVANDLSDAYAATRVVDVFVGDKFVPTRTVGATAAHIVATLPASAYAEAAALVANDLSTQYLNRPAESAGAFRAADGTVYRARVSRSSGRLYAEVLANGKFTYASGAIYRVREADRLTLDEAIALSALLGECIICGRTLSDPKSVAKGIGPVCRKRLAAA